MAKGQFRLNAFFDPTARRGLQATQRTAMLRAWLAWFGGEPRTAPGERISMHDPPGGLFTWADPTWLLEAGYGAAGARCRGGALPRGRAGHRRAPAFQRPVERLPGWSSLPTCAATNYAGSGAVLGSRRRAFGGDRPAGE